MQRLTELGSLSNFPQEAAPERLPSASTPATVTGSINTASYSNLFSPPAQEEAARKANLPYVLNKSGKRSKPHGDSGQQRMPSNEDEQAQKLVDMWQKVSDEKMVEIICQQEANDQQLTKDWARTLHQAQDKLEELARREDERRAIFADLVAGKRDYDELYDLCVQYTVKE